ncbi:MAG: hypothetical protein M3P18_06235, partial [Actinomycetota bacterium]|nr:hypothetical protein [Actinomycetota bacterium]
MSVKRNDATRSLLRQRARWMARSCCTDPILLAPRDAASEKRPKIRENRLLLSDALRCAGKSGRRCLAMSEIADFATIILLVTAGFALAVLST